ARRTLEEAARVLRPGGLLVVRVPNGPVHATAASALARLGPLARLRGLDAFPIVHVFAFGRGALVRLLTGAGFDVVDVINSDLAGAPGGGAGRALGAAVRTLAALAAGYPGWLAVGVAESDAASVDDARRRGVSLLDVPTLGREVGARDVS